MPLKWRKNDLFKSAQNLLFEFVLLLRNFNLENAYVSKSTSYLKNYTKNIKLIFFINNATNL